MGPLPQSQRQEEVLIQGGAEGDGVVGGGRFGQQVCTWLVPHDIWGMMKGEALWGSLLLVVPVSEILNSEGQIHLERLNTVSSGSV